MDQRWNELSNLANKKQIKSLLKASGLAVLLGIAAGKLWEQGEAFGEAYAVEQFAKNMKDDESSEKEEKNN